MKVLIYLVSLLAPRRLRAAWREEWLGELHAARRAGGGRTLRFALGAPSDALSSRWTTRQDSRAPWQGAWSTDLRQSARGLGRARAHVAVVALGLGAGIALCTTTFSILNAFTHGELPGVSERERLARLHLGVGLDGPPEARNFAWFSPRDYEIVREGSPSLPAIAAEGGGTFAVRAAGSSATSVRGGWVSGNYFDVLGTEPHLGRLLRPSDDRRDAPLAAVISHAFWSEHLGAPARIAGQTLAIGGRDAVIAGVAPQGFGGLRGGPVREGAEFAIFLPLARLHDWPLTRPAESRWLNLYGRLTVPLDRAQLAEELLPLAGRLEAADPDNRRHARIAVTENWLTPVTTRRAVVAAYLLLLAAPLTVLAIGCASVANMQLMRASLRTRELAVRAALGASRGQIVRLLTFEAVLLVVAALAVGAAGTWLLLRVVAPAMPMPVPLDTRVVLFMAAIAVLVIGATGLLPALFSTRAVLAARLRAGGRSIASGDTRLRRGLVIAQVTLCFMLLLAAVVSTRGFLSSAAGLPSHALETIVAELRFDVGGEYGPAERRAFIDAFDARMRADRRVRAIAYSTSDPFSTGNARVWGAGDAAEAGPFTGAVSVAGDFFDISDVRVVSGRALTAADAAAAPATVVVVNEAFVSRFAIEEPVVGRPLRLSLSRAEEAAPRRVTIVGVTSQPAAPGLSDPIGERPTIFLPLGTPPSYIAAWISAADASQLDETVRRTLADLDPELPALTVRTLDTYFAEDTDTLRVVAQIANVLGTVALLLAIAGLYSVVAAFAALRAGEFGIRRALGARAADILGMVFGQALRLVGGGLALGAVLATPLLMALQTSFPFTDPFDPAVVLPATLALVLTAVLAAWLPARRAATIQATAALRTD